ncbi:MAG: DUF2760 domain-containing protein [Planctomycetes bacterium]|nr:DUF2760 domain-containing protein [Planctomycetota bacterium]
MRLFLAIRAFFKTLFDGAFAEGLRGLLAPKPPEPPEETSHLALLAVLQREGRLIDFLKERVDEYADAQIGAAVRSIHAESGRALADLVPLGPILDAEEGTEVTIRAGFDPAAIRLSGNATGDPPFRGILRHKGWRAETRAIPPFGYGSDPTIIAPAEVEIP